MTNEIWLVMGNLGWGKATYFKDARHPSARPQGQGNRGMTSIVCTPREKFTLSIMGRDFRILAVFNTDEDANAFMHEHEGAAVIAVFDDRIYIADKADKGNVTH
jgi:hypothetical protein